MLEPSQLRFWKVALDSGLVTEAQLRACWDRIAPEKRTVDAADRRLARRAIEANHLTVWQAQQLLLGARASSLRYDRYILLDLLGQGGMGRVYLARDSRLNRKVALKVLSRDRMSNPRALARFRREAKVGAQLQQENLVRIYDEGEVNNSLYLVMEYIEGKNVGQIISHRGPLPPPIAIRIAHQVALGLEHAHEKGLVHRDVNPMNILIDRQGTAKLTDLGLAIDLGDQGDAVTREGATVGTFDYISPEQARHSRLIDIRSDIYSLGCTLYHTLAGRVPFPQPSLPEKLYCHQLVSPDSLDTLVSDLPPGVQEVISKMMAKRPEDRYERPQLVADALLPFVGPPVTLSQIEATPEQPIWIDPVAAENDAATEVGISPTPVSTEYLNGPPSNSAPTTAPTVVDPGPRPLSDSSNRRTPVAAQPASAPKLTRKRLLQASSIMGAVLLVSLIWNLWPPGTSSSTEGGTLRRGGADNKLTVPDIEAAPLVVPAQVRWLDDNTTTPRMELQQAIQQAAGKNAEVWLDTSEPLVIPESLSLTVSGGAVVLRASGERSGNETAHVEVRRSDEKPLFLVLPDSKLTVSRVCLDLQDARPATEGTKPQLSLFTVYGDLKLTECCFFSGPGPATRLASLEGKTCEIADCAILGFTSPLQVVASAASQISLVNCLIHTPTEAEASAGWALQIVATAIGRASAQGRRLNLDHCTVIGRGILRLEDVGPSIPLQVETTACVLAASSLVGWSCPQAFPEGLSWTAQKDIYDIFGGPWVLLGPTLQEAIPSSPRTITEWAAKSIKQTACRSLNIPLVALKLDSHDQVRLSAYQLSDPTARDVGVNPAKLVHDTAASGNELTPRH